MRIGLRTRIALDAILTAGIDILDFASRPTTALVRGFSDYDEHSFRRQMARMREAGLVEWQETENRSKWVITVTALGKKEFTQEIEPESHWSRQWDGRWRLINFDLPTAARAKRNELNNWLKTRRFGRVQRSSWITPIFPDHWKDEIAKISVRPSDISFFEGRPFGQSVDADFVTSAWDFKAINARYQKLIDFHRSLSTDETSDWLMAESLLWKDAFEIDPFLPDSLLPSSYLGKQALAQRRRTFATYFSPEA